MKGFIFLSASVIFYFSSAAEGVDIESIRLTSAPAFSLIGVEPVSVERPDGPKAFSVAVLGDSSGDLNGLFGQNVSVETSPFWWTSRARLLKADEYYLSRDMFDNFVRTFTLSIATKGERLNGEDGGALGVGFRSRLNFGKRSDIAEALEGIQNVVTDLVSSGIEPDQSVIEEKVDKFRHDIENPYGWHTQIAGGIAYDSVESSFSDLDQKRWGVWFNAGYRMKDSGALGNVKFLFLGRYLKSDGVMPNEDFDSEDIGIRLLWSKPSERLSISFEAIKRNRSGGSEDTGRHALVVEYRLSDRTAITLSSGDDFDQDMDNAEERFTLLGFNVAIGKLPGLSQ